MTHMLQDGSEEVEYSVVENPRLVSRVRIHVGPDGRVEVEKPQGAGPDEVQRAVQKRSRWIIRNVRAAGTAKKQALPRRYVSGETHFYLGKRYKLIVTEAPKIASDVRLCRGRIEVTLPVADPVAVRRRLRRWYREKAMAYFERKLPELVEQVNGIIAVPSFQLLTMEKQWGSCSPSGQISLNPSLIKAPSQCVEYVLTHELCHLLEHNHSKRFYVLLDRHRPDWRRQKRELDALAEQLLAE
jgi:predicted metal-dependent hydrolase